MPQMTITRTLTLSLLMALIALPACHKAPKDAPAAESKPPATVAPLGFARTDADAQVSLTLPDPIKLYPELHTQLYKEGEATLTAFIAQARKDRAQIKADGFDQPPYSHNIDWKISAQSAHLVSLFAEEDDYQGGAHPNHTFQTLLWDKTANSLMATSKLFVAGGDFKTVDAYVCRQIEAARSKRNGEPMSMPDSTCPKFADSHLILIAATQTGKIGAVDALYAPYEVGAYAEGAYEIRVPQILLKGLIAPQFADQFGGEAVHEEALSDAPQ